MTSPSGGRGLDLAHDDREVGKWLENASHAATTAWMETPDYQRLADMRLRHHEIVDVERVIVLRIRDRRFQAFAHVARNALAREFKIGKRGCNLLAANKLSKQVELLRAHAQHAGDSLRLTPGKLARPGPLAHEIALP